MAARGVVLSKRLQMLADMVEVGDRVADVGCDPVNLFGTEGDQSKSHCNGCAQGTSGSCEGTHYFRWT